MGSGVTWEKEEDRLLAWSWFAASEDLNIGTGNHAGEIAGEEVAKKGLGEELAKEVAGAGVEAGAGAISENNDPAPGDIVIFIILCLVIAICICLNRRKRRSSTSTLNGTNTN